MPSKSSPRALGPSAERRVRRYYRLRGYRVLEANARAGRNELDIVLRRGRRLVFCEVKARSGDGYGDPREAVGAEKERRLHRAAETWLARNPALLELDVVFEVVGVRGRRLVRVPLG
ncbi:MAG TPA: YraN family protein [Gaiellaceae bacterium]|jgi:putative endonuclease